MDHLDVEFASNGMHNISHDQCRHYVASYQQNCLFYTSGVLVTSVGLLNNAVALWVLKSSSPNSHLRKSGAFVFLVNQSLVDLLVNTSVVLMQVRHLQ